MSHQHRGLLRGILATAIALFIGAAGNAPCAANSSPWPTFHHDNQRTGLSQVDTSANTGAVKWKFTAPSGGGVSQSPVIATDGTIYVGDDSGNFYALNPDGSQKWTFGGTTSMGFRLNFTGSSPAVGPDGTIYVGEANNNLFAINPDGTQKWEFTTSSSVDAPVIGPDGVVYVGSADNKLYAINPDGSQKWTLALVASNCTSPPCGGVGSSSPALGADGTVYVGSTDGNLYAINPDGSQKWNFTTNGPIRHSSSAIVADGTIYILSTDSNLYAINPDGSEKWQFDTRGWSAMSVSSPAIGADGTIYIGSGASGGPIGENRVFYAINPNGSQKWQFLTDAWVFSAPAIGADGTIYFGSADLINSSSQTFYAVNPDGTQKWSFPGSPYTYFVSSPAIGADGTVYVGLYHSPGGVGLYAFGSGGDITPPTITIISPANTTYTLNHAVPSAYTCTDSDDTVTACNGPVANGADIDTSAVGTKTFTVNASDSHNNSSTASVTYTVAYNICPLYDSSHSVKSGATIPIKLELCDINGTDESASGIVAHATSVVQATTDASELLQDAGNANPDNDFRFDSTLGTSGGYIFNLSTSGYPTGTFDLQFTAGSDPTTHVAPFQVH